MKYLITSALPYANGPLHFGHLAGAYLPADVITRHKKNQGLEVIHISGSDEHGVAIMLNAQKVKKPYRDYVNEWHQDHKKLFKEYGIEFDFFGQTSAEYHAQEVVEWFKLLNEKGFIGTKDEQQLFCNDCKNHLPDRFVEGECYECHYPNARGDECPNCGIWIEPSKLIKPVCKMCGSKNIKEVSVTQYYLLLSKFHSEFRSWFETKKATWRNTVYPYVDSLTKEGLHDRAITRDLDWGIDVPLPNTKGKKLYVWFDAPIGYVSNTKQYLKEQGRSEDYIKDWWKNDQVKIINFIGKDNIIFHGVIFPMMCLASGITNPVTDLPANMYVNLAGKQFSKSSGWYVDAKDALSRFGEDALRYYLIGLIPENSDSSFTWEGFQAKVNNELANNIGNLLNRCLKFWQKNWGDGIDAKHFASFFKGDMPSKLAEEIKEHNSYLDNYEIKKGLEKLMSIGHSVNTFFSDRAPWAQFKQDKELAAETIAHTGIQIFILGVLFSTYLPKLSKSILSYFGDEIDESLKKQIYNGDLSDLQKFFEKTFIISKPVDVLVPKIEDSVITQMNEELGKLG